MESNWSMASHLRSCTGRKSTIAKWCAPTPNHSLFNLHQIHLHRAASGMPGTE
jgi:hypothetical protein